MEISVVIPTRNRKTRLLSLLANLQQSSFLVSEIIIVDASDTPLQPGEYSSSESLHIIYLTSESSVCIQRNIGIRTASAPWIFLCDDDIEVPDEYLQKLAAHILAHPEAGAVSGVILQQENGEWTGSYPLHSGKEILLKYIFGLGIWGPVASSSRNFFIKKTIRYYAKKGNYISKAGWPVITDFAGEYFVTPVYGLGASLVCREWLLAAPYDEVLDPHGIGDNYGVAIRFPRPGIHVVNDAVVYHHHEPEGRLALPLRYYCRALALDFFIKKGRLKGRVRRLCFLWSLLGNALIYLAKKDHLMSGPALKTFRRIFSGNNPYYAADNRHEKVVEPTLS